MEIYHNLHPSNINKVLLGTIGSQCGGSDDSGAKFINPLAKTMQKADSRQSFVSSFSQNDGGPIDIEKILSGEETRTNLMVQNIPCRYTFKEI